MSIKEAFTRYRRKQTAELRSWQADDNMTGISVSAEDTKAGSPKPGDMIARNPKNHADQWLVAAAYFADNFEPFATLQPSGERRETIARMINPAAWIIVPESYGLSTQEELEDKTQVGAERRIARELACRILASGLVQDEATTRADEREKCRKVARKAILNMSQDDRKSGDICDHAITVALRQAGAES